MPVVYSHQALSGDGRAAHSYAGIGTHPQQWVQIQEATFTNWVNEQLGKQNMAIDSLTNDFSDGVNLISLVEILQSRKCTGKVYYHSVLDVQRLANIELALEAMQEDGVKLVNIGPHDISEGNNKLILGLIWCLILRYQIGGKTRIPPRKLMLAWFQAVLPDMKIRNFTSDWNSGIALSALVDYCRPGLCPSWKNLNPANAADNCDNAMRIAQNAFGIPMVLAPENMASSNIDELSCMTYLSYFVRQDSPGFHATLERLRKVLANAHVKNFTTDWNDGLLLSELVYHLGGNVQGWPNMRRDRSQWIKNINAALTGGRGLGIEPIMNSQEIAEAETEHLGMMAYVAKLCQLPPVIDRPQRFADKDRAQLLVDHRKTVMVEQQALLDVLYLDPDIHLKDLSSSIMDPTGGHLIGDIRRSPKGAVVSFVPQMPGPYECPAHSGRFHYRDKTFIGETKGQYRETNVIIDEADSIAKKDHYHPVGSSVGRKLQCQDKLSGLSPAPLLGHISPAYVAGLRKTIFQP